MCLRYIAGMMLLLSTVSCAPVQWDMQVSKDVDLVWPPPPNPEKVKYLGEITSFKPTGKSFVSILLGVNNDMGHIMKPVSVAVAGDGRIAIADLQLQGVHLYVPAEHSYRLLHKIGKQVFKSPVGVVFDDKLNLFVSDSVLGKVFIFDSAGKAVGEINSAGNEPLRRPTGMVYVPGKEILCVIDTLTNKIDVFDMAGNFKYSFGGRGIGDGEFNMPTHITAASDAYDRGRTAKILVNDAMNFRTQIFSDSGNFIEKFGHHGDGSGDFAMPKGIAADRWGVVYVAETLFDIIQVFDMQGNYLMSIGGKGTGAGQFWMPSGLFIDRYDKLYVCDTYNKRMQLFQLRNIGTEGSQ